MWYISFYGPNTQSKSIFSLPRNDKSTTRPFTLGTSLIDTGTDVQAVFQILPIKRITLMCSIRTAKLYLYA